MNKSKYLNKRIGVRKEKNNLSDRKQQESEKKIM